MTYIYFRYFCTENPYGFSCYLHTQVKQTKKIGKIVTLTVLTVVILFYLLPNVTHIEQSLEIDAPPDKIFDLINRPDRWAEWYVPLQDKAGVQIRFSGPSEGKGASMRWVSDGAKITGGTMTIRNSRSNRNVSTVVDIDKRHSAVMTFSIKPFKKDASLLTVTSRLRFPQDSLLHYLRMMFDRSEELEIIDYLENISDVATAKAEGITVRLQQVEPFTYISIIDSCAWEHVSLRMGGLYEELNAFIATSGITTINKPIAIYHQLSAGKVVYELGIPVNEEVQPTGRIQKKIMRGGNNVVADYYGPYDTLEDGHNAVQQWLIRYGRRINGYPWEMYVINIATESDPHKWLTRIFYPVD